MFFIRNIFEIFILLVMVLELLGIPINTIVETDISNTLLYFYSFIGLFLAMLYVYPLVVFKIISALLLLVSFLFLVGAHWGELFTHQAAIVEGASIIILTFVYKVITTFWIENLRGSKQDTKYPSIPQGYGYVGIFKITAYLLVVMIGLVVFDMVDEGQFTEPSLMGAISFIVCILVIDAWETYRKEGS